MPRPKAHTRGTLSHPPTVFLAALVAQIILSFLPPGTLAIPTVVRASGGAWMGLGVLLNVVATRQFARRDTPVHPSADMRVLVTDGVFRWTRNPMYLGMGCILGGAALALASPWALVVLPLFVLWMNRLIGWEESRLEAAFGDRYLGYARRVRRWL